ncbi:hypothetical protein ABTL60_19730, partial [Acinetobacter baumannii]
SGRAAAGYAGSAAEGLFEADGLAGKAGGKFVCAGNNGFVDQLAGHSRNHEIAKTKLFACPEINIDTVPK